MNVKELLAGQSVAETDRHADLAQSGIEIPQQRSAEEAVTEALRNAIHSGYLKPGQRLSQADLAKQLGVSRIPLRDALRRLESEALVTMNGRHGTWVSSLSIDEIKEIYEIRIMLEERCAKYAIRNMSDEDLSEIVRLFEEMDESETDPKNQAFTARRKFYARFYECADRPLMRAQILLLRDNVSRYHRVKDRSHAHEEHSIFKEAIIARDAKRAASILTRHLKEARDDLLKDMKSRSGPGH